MNRYLFTNNKLLINNYNNNKFQLRPLTKKEFQNNNKSTNVYRNKPASNGLQINYIDLIDFVCLFYFFFFVSLDSSGFFF